MADESRIWCFSWTLSTKSGDENQDTPSRQQQDNTASQTVEWQNNGEAEWRFITYQRQQRKYSRNWRSHRIGRIEGFLVISIPKWQTAEADIGQQTANDKEDVGQHGPLKRTLD